jgi:8-oxo-dGTP diphosphatase
MRQCTLLFLRRNQELLLAMKKRGLGVGKWNGVGGKLEQGETIEAAAIRECEEEIGVTPLTFHKVAIHEFTNDVPDHPLNQQAHVYIADTWKGEPEETEEMAPRWFKEWEIPYDHMWEDDALWLPLVLRGKKLYCHFDFDENDAMRGVQIDIVKELT